MRFLGSASLYPHVQGMFSEYFVLGERQCYPVAADISLGEIAFEHVDFGYTPERNGFSDVGDDARAEARGFRRGVDG